MKDIRTFLTHFKEASEGFSLGKLKNNPGDSTGSGADAQYLNDFLYAFYAFILKYGLISGTDESELNSDFLDAIENCVNEAPVMSYPIKDGETINAGDLVSLINGEVERYSDSTTFIEGSITNLTSSAEYFSAVALSATKVLVAYRHIIDSTLYGEACVLSIDGTTITAGTPVVFDSIAATGGVKIEYISPAALSSTKVIVAYKKGSTESCSGEACVLSIDGTTITAGTPVVFNSAYTTYVSAVALSDTKVVVAYKYFDYNSIIRGEACVLTIDDTTITVGTPVVFSSGSISFTSAVALSDTKVLVAYTKNYDSGGAEACVLSIDGTTIAVGTPVVFNSASIYYISAAALSDTKVVVAYYDPSSSYGDACVLSIDDTTITVGTSVVFNSVDIRDISTVALSATKVLVAYRNIGGPDYGMARVLSIDGTTIAVGTSMTFNSAYTSDISAVALSDTKVVVAYYDPSSSYGEACVLEREKQEIQPFGMAKNDNSPCSVSLLQQGKRISGLSLNPNTEYFTDGHLVKAGPTFPSFTVVPIFSANVGFRVGITYDDASVLHIDNIYLE